MNDGVFQNDAPYKTGHLNKRVTLLNLNEVEDEYNLTHQELVDAVGHKVWAKIEPLRGTAYIEAMAMSTLLRSLWVPTRLRP